MEFEKLFTAHLLIAADLVNAAKNGNSAEVEVQRKKWYANGEEIATFLSRINPYWDKAVWRDMFFMHLDMTEKEAVQILTKQYEKSIEQYDAIEEEALRMADYMAFGLISQFKI